MYIGFYETAQTSKNQLTFPSKLKTLTGQNLFVASWFEHSLIVLPEHDAEETVGKILAQKPELLPEVRDLERFLFSTAVILRLDSKNRLVLPKHLREYMGIVKKAVFLGVGDRIEL